MIPRFSGLFPVVPTTFTASGELDLESQVRCVDFIIDTGADGICILANFSEQFSLSDDERESITRTVLSHVAGRVPVIVTTSHFSTSACIGRSIRAQDLGAAMVMVMPPFHGATFKVPEAQIETFYSRLSDALEIPIMVQDAPASGTTLTAPFLARLAREIENVSYFKIETPGAANKLRDLIRLGGDAVEGPWDGEEGVTLLADLDAGATGAMTGGSFPDGIRPIIEAHRSGDHDQAFARYQFWLPLINFENRQGSFLTAKTLMKEGGIIACEAPRHPWPAMHAATRQALIDLAKRLDPLVLRWAR